MYGNVWQSVHTKVPYSLLTYVLFKSMCCLRCQHAAIFINQAFAEVQFCRCCSPCGVALQQCLELSRKMSIEALHDAALELHPNCSSLVSLSCLHPSHLTFVLPHTKKVRGSLVIKTLPLLINLVFMPPQATQARTTRRCMTLASQTLCEPSVSQLSATTGKGSSAATHTRCAQYAACQQQPPIACSCCCNRI